MTQPSQVSPVLSRRSEPHRSERPVHPSAWSDARVAGACSAAASVRASAAPQVAVGVDRDLRATPERREVSP